LFIFSDAIIFSKEMVEHFLNEINYFSADSPIEHFEKTERVARFDFDFWFYLS